MIFQLPHSPNQSHYNMKILFILPYIPYPLNSGGNQATYNMINKIKELYDVSLLLQVETKDDEQAVYHLQEKWKDVRFFIHHSQKENKEEHFDEKLYPNTLSFRIFNSIQQSMVRKMQRRIRKHQQRTAKELAETRDLVRQYSCINKDVLNIPADYLDYVYQISREGFDVIQIEFYECLPLVYILPKTAIKVFVQHEIRFIRNENEMDLFIKQEPNDLYRLQTQKEIELSALSHYDAIIALTEEDKKIMLRERPSLNIYVSPAIISLPEVHTVFTPANELVFVGSGSHFPNTDGLIWFCKEVLPILQKEGNTINLNIVGNWNKETQTLIKNISPNIHFTGFIDNLFEFLSGKISIVPIRIGSGMRMKILDSIMAFSPIVTTSKGCEGLPLFHERNCLIADNPEEFAHATQKLINDINLQKQFAETISTDFTRDFQINTLLDRRMAFYEMIRSRNR